MPQDTAQFARPAFKVVDADTHLSEPHDLWLKRAPANMRDRVPQVATLDGKPAWVIDGDKSIGFGASAASAVLKDGSKPKGLHALEQQIDGVFPAAWNMRERVKYMDESGVWAQIMYPNVLGFGGQNVVKVDPELRLLCTQIYNDAMAEMQEESGQRIFPMALLPWWDAKQAAKEAERAAGLGLRGIAINSDPHNHHGLDGRPLPDLGGAYWDPLWEVCADKALPINFHIGASEQTWDWLGAQSWPSLNEEVKGSLGSCMLFMNNARVAANIILSGLFDRHPTLKFVSVESGLGWVPFLLEALEYELSELNYRVNFQHTPIEYFRRNLYACFWFERRELSHMIHAVGVDNVMFETDFPHPTCLYPDPLGYQADTIGKLDPTDCAKVMGGNAAKLYRIPLA